MASNQTKYSHRELNLLLFALESSELSAPADPSECETACPIIDTAEQLLCGGMIPPKQQLARHLNNHIREALIESGVFEHLATADGRTGAEISENAETSFRLANYRLSQWSSEVTFSDTERELLLDALKALPRSAWLSMPVILWKLRKKVCSVPA